MNKKILLTFGFVLFVVFTLNNLQAYNNSNKITNECCITGEACCDTKSSCCTENSKTTGTSQGNQNEPANDCCGTGEECCVTNAACYTETSKTTGTSQGNQNEQMNDCCGIGEECCVTNAACCTEETVMSGSFQGSMSVINSDDKNCCKDGDKTCCDKDKACCTDKNNSGNSQGTVSDSATCLVSKETFLSGSGEKFTYLGKEYEFCCGGCVSEFKSASIKYTDGKAICPICNHDDGMESLTSVHDKTTYYFCNNSCKEEFEKNPEKILGEYKDGKKEDGNHKH